MKEKQSYCKKPIYVFNRKSSKTHYIVVTSRPEMLNNNLVIVVKTKNIYQKMSILKNINLLILRYYEIENFDFSILEPFKENKDTYRADIYNIIETIYDVKPSFPDLNIAKNSCLDCELHGFVPRNNKQMIDHLKICKTYKYSLFSLPVPKYLEPSKNRSANLNVTINNTQNNFSYISYRRTGDFIREHITKDDQVSILNSMDKLGEMIKRHFQFPEIAGNIRVKNTSPYNTCEVYNGKDFVVVDNQEAFRYYICDHLDSMDYMAYYLKDDRLTRNLESYDKNLRQNDSNMNKCIKKTIKTLKHLSKNLPT